MHEQTRIRRIRRNHQKWKQNTIHKRFRSKLNCAIKRLGIRSHHTDIIGWPKELLAFFIMHENNNKMNFRIVQNRTQCFFFLLICLYTSVFHFEFEKRVPRVLRSKLIILWFGWGVHLMFIKWASIQAK